MLPSAAAAGPLLPGALRGKNVWHCGRLYANTRALIGTGAAAAAALAATSLLADPPEVVAAEARHASGGWHFDVTLLHPDTGWDHYADAWAVHAPDGTLLGTRELLHPHETEQPFTRSLSGIAIPDGIAEVTIRARCSVDGWSAEPVTVILDR